MNDPLDKAHTFAKNVRHIDLQKILAANISSKFERLVGWIVHDDLGTRLKAYEPSSSALASRFKARGLCPLFSLAMQETSIPEKGVGVQLGRAYTNQDCINQA